MTQVTQGVSGRARTHSKSPYRCPSWQSGHQAHAPRPGRGIRRKVRGSSGSQGRQQAAGTCTLSLAYPVPLSSP